jgi:hypothetical protein
MNDSRLRAIPWHTNRFLGQQFAAPGANIEQIRERNVPSWLHQRWGATATGPVVIPKIYNGRAKTFWSFGYEGLKIKRNLSFTGTMPTAKQRNGDFSELLALGPTYQIYDPFTIRPAPNGRFSRTALAGNIIPANRIDPIAKKILAFYPCPISLALPTGGKITSLRKRLIAAIATSWPAWITTSAKIIGCLCATRRTINMTRPCSLKAAQRVRLPNNRGADWRWMMSSRSARRW